MTTEIIEVPKEATNYPATVQGLMVVDQVSFAKAGEAVKTLAVFKKQLKDYFAPMKDAAHAAHKAICEKENESLRPLTEVEKTLRDRMGVYATEQERIRAAEERRLREAEEARAAAERKKLEEAAAKAEAKGKDERAEALREKAEAVYVAPVSVASTVAPVKTDSFSVGMVDQLNIDVTDLKAFVKALVEQNSALSMIDVKTGPLAAWVKANQIKAFPGLSIVVTKVPRVR